MKTLLSAVALLSLSSASALASQPIEQTELPDTFLIPQRVISIGGDAEKARDLVAVLYSREDLHYNDPSGPRFLFFDKKGKVALGIGGYVKGTLQYDFAGAIDDGAKFVTYDIPVPRDPALRSQFFANANQSTIFLQMVGRTERFGTYELYVRTNFSGGGPKGYDMKLKQAYLRLGYVTAGLTNSTFVDGAAGTPTIDDQGPAGEISAKNIILQYKPKIDKHLTVGISVEMPTAGYQINSNVIPINQRIPDIPAFVQYGWDDGASHVRISGLLRNLSYRDLVTGCNRFDTGWAVQLSGMVKVAKPLTFFYQGALGDGYGRYINDLSDADVDLIPSHIAGKMFAPRMSNFEVGATVNASDKMFFAASYSQAHLYGQKVLGPKAYKYGRYLSCTAFYDVVPDLRIGVEYLHGDRHDLDGEHGSANRIMGMIQLKF